jgi:hypothetical protein
VSADGTVAFVLAPDARYDGEDRERLRAFVEDGGTLVVADAFGPHGNALLEDVGASARFHGDPLRDEHTYYRTPAFPIATDVDDHPYVARSEEITLNHGTAVVPGDAAILARSSESAYLDHNRNRELDGDERLAAYPVVTTEEIGDGEVVAVSDPSVFINVMLDRPGNRAFANGLFTLHERVLFDTSHSADLPPAAIVTLALRESAILQSLLIGSLVLGIAAMSRWSTVERFADQFRRGESADQSGLSETEMHHHIADRYPELEDSQRDRVVSTFNSRGGKEREE